MNAALLKKMRDMGLSLDQAIELAEVWEQGAAQPVPAYDPRAAKKAYDREYMRAKREEEARAKAEAEQVVRPSHDVVNDTDDAPLSLPPSPQTPQPPTHTRVSVTTREDARESAAFARFWGEYPRKTAKADARKAFGKAWKKLPPHDEETILIGALERAKAAWTDAQFIPHAATWLNGERWNDEPLPQPTPRKTHDRPHHDRQPTAREDRLSRMLSGALAAADGAEHVFRTGDDGTRPLLPGRTGTDG